MKVLFDHNVPHKLARSLRGHQVETADAMGWAELKNGDLLVQAERNGFDVMVTADKNLSYQQNLKDRQLALVVLQTNDWNVIKRNELPVLTAVTNASPGSFQTVHFALPT